MGLKKNIEKGNTHQTNEYWCISSLFIDMKSGKVHVTYEGYKDKAAKDSGAENDDVICRVVDISEVIPKKKLDDIKARIYEKSTQSEPQTEKKPNEEWEMEDVIVAELNPLVEAEEA